MAGIVKLQAGEEIVLEVLPSPFWTAKIYIMSFGLWEIWRRRRQSILTNQRLIVLAGLITRKQTVIPLARLQDVNVKKSPFSGGRITLSSAGGNLGVEFIGPLSLRNARLFEEKISEQMARFHSGGGGGA